MGQMRQWAKTILDLVVARGVAAIVAVATISACVVHGDYRVGWVDVAAVATRSPEERAHAAVAAERTGDHRPVFVRADLLRDVQPVSENSADGARARAAAPAPEVTAGAVLTCVGSVLSVTGTLGYLLLRDGPHDDAALGFGITTLIAEPLMIVGTVLWIHGLVRPPQEVPRGRPGMLYIDETGRLRF